MTQAFDTRSVFDETHVTRAVIWNQCLFTAGYSLTTGGFLLYFGRELGAKGFLIALLLAIPETVGLTGLITRRVIRKLGNRRRVYIIFSLAARYFSLGIPLLAFPSLRPTWVNPLWLMVVWLAISEALGAVAYMSYLSWLSDLVPERYWGRFFAKRNIAKLCVLLVVPVVGGYLRDWWRHEVSPEMALLAYVLAFVVGVVFLLLSILPMSRLVNVPVVSNTLAIPKWKLIGDAFRDRSMRFLLIHNWWLAFANGLTQAAFFSYLFGPLSVGLGMYYVLSSVMRVVKIPVSQFVGRICDERGNKGPLFWGTIVSSCALPFWLLATPQQWGWVVPAYALWGAFAAVNISGRNLILKLSPRSDNSTQLALFRQIGGLLAGASGLLGGICLDAMQTSGFLFQLADYRVESYQVLFLISWFGRFTSAFWILPIAEPEPSTESSRFESD